MVGALASCVLRSILPEQLGGSRQEKWNVYMYENNYIITAMQQLNFALIKIYRHLFISYPFNSIYVHLLYNNQL